MSRETDVPSEENRLVAPEMQACPKCRGEMVEGWLPQYKGEAAFAVPITWQPGAPVQPDLKFFGKPIKAGFLKPPNPKLALHVSAFRCVHCGFLEFYARGESAH